MKRKGRWMKSRPYQIPRKIHKNWATPLRPKNTLGCRTRVPLATSIPCSKPSSWRPNSANPFTSGNTTRSFVSKKRTAFPTNYNCYSPKCTCRRISTSRPENWPSHFNGPCRSLFSSTTLRSSFRCFLMRWRSPAKIRRSMDLWTAFFPGLTWAMWSARCVSSSRLGPRNGSSCIWRWKACSIRWDFWFFGGPFLFDLEVQ